MPQEVKRTKSQCPSGTQQVCKDRQPPWAAKLLGALFLGTDASLTGGRSEWSNMQPGPSRDQALLDAQLYGELAAWGIQTPSPAFSALSPSQGLLDSPLILPPPLLQAARLPLQSPPPPPPPQDIVADPASMPRPPPTPPQLAPEPESVPTTTVEALLGVCPYKLESRNCPYGIRCTMMTPCNVSPISISFVPSPSS